MWTKSARPSEIASAIEQFFPGLNPQALVAGIERYRKLNIWKTTPVLDPKSFDRFQDILVQGRVLEGAKRVRFQDLVRTEFASKAT